MPNFIPNPCIPGIRYGRLTVIGEAGYRENRRLARVLCDCGADKVVVMADVRSGHTKSCGCLNAELRLKRSKTHGMSETPEFHVFEGMRQRCFNPQNPAYDRYGGRGIAICERWNGPNGFRNFLADMGPRPIPWGTLDRIDNSGSYSPENCRWATRTEQGRNKRNNALIEFRGETRCASSWEEETGFPATAITRRIKRGWTIERALTEPLRKTR